ncbi:MAG: DUF4190 domain-containing protein [Clostridia bacterium]|nr:DUF4190 domain-containing protein [Clostridia bacterium]MCI9413069.1 DUF4190 domain-containing protein [Clostridia bacterium]
MEENNNPIQEPGVKKEEYTAQTTQNVGQRKQNSMALASFIIALVGLIVAGLPCGIVAIILGIVGLVKFDATKEKGKGFAIAGLVVGVIDVIAVILNIIIQASALL